MDEATNYDTRENITSNRNSRFIFFIKFPDKVSSNISLTCGKPEIIKFIIIYLLLILLIIIIFNLILLHPNFFL